MAMYHFRLKSDKKPNGTKISAVKHVEYINREGAFSEDEHEKGNDKFVGNFITTEKTPKSANGTLSAAGKKRFAATNTGEHDNKTMK